MINWENPSQPKIVLSGRSEKDAFDAHSVAFPGIYKEAGTTYLYYTGSPDRKWSSASIGVAWSTNGESFERCSNSVILNQSSSDFSWEAVTPAVVKFEANYYMILSGRHRRHNRRALGVAYSSSPKGPFSIIKTVHAHTEQWEGYSIDNGTTIVKVGGNKFLFYYSNCALSFVDTLLRRKLKRQIGFIELAIDDSQHEIEITTREGPLLGLNGVENSWNESIFCPGYVQLEHKGLLFFASSTYSLGHIPQAIGYAFVDSPKISRILSSPMMLIGPSAFGYSPLSVLAFDSPSPLLSGNQIDLFFSIMDRQSGDWKMQNLQSKSTANHPLKQFLCSCC
jgi:hypothetical protein